MTFFGRLLGVIAIATKQLVTVIGIVSNDGIRYVIAVQYFPTCSSSISATADRILSQPTPRNFKRIFQYLDRGTSRRGSGVCRTNYNRAEM